MSFLDDVMCPLCGAMITKPFEIKDKCISMKVTVTASDTFGDCLYNRLKASSILYQNIENDKK